MKKIKPMSIKQKHFLMNLGIEPLSNWTSKDASQAIDLALFDKRMSNEKIIQRGLNKLTKEQFNLLSRLGQKNIDPELSELSEFHADELIEKLRASRNITN